MKFRSEKGITLTALAVSIIVMLILASVTVRTSFTAYESTRTEKFKAEMKVIQETVYNQIVPDYEKWKVETENEYKQYEDQSNYYYSLAQEADAAGDYAQREMYMGLYRDSQGEMAIRADTSIQRYIERTYGSTPISFSDLQLNGTSPDSITTSYYWDLLKSKFPGIAKDNPEFETDVTKMGGLIFYEFNPDQLYSYFFIKNMDMEVYINFDYKIIFAKKSVKVDGSNVFALFELESNVVSYDYDTTSATSDAIIRIDEIANYGTTRKIKLTLNTDNIPDSNDVLKYRIQKAYFKNVFKANKWLEVDDLRECSYSTDGKSVTFSVYESGEYFFRIEDVDGQSTETMETFIGFNIKNYNTGDSKNYSLLEDNKGYKIMLVNRPVVNSDMVPIKWVYDDASLATGAWVVCSTVDPEWYNYSYEHKMWANVMFKNDMNYNRGFDIGTVYKEGETGSMFVWIPRFATTSEVLQENSNPSDPPNTRYFLDSNSYYNIQFLRDYSNTTTFGTNAFADKSLSLFIGSSETIDESEQSKIAIPKAFTNSDSTQGSWDSELKGLWYAKYNTGLVKANTSVNTNVGFEYDTLYTEDQYYKPVSKPYFMYWRNISFTSAFSQSLMAYKSFTDNTDINTHLMKGTEYDAIKALTYNGEFGNKNLQGNTANRLAGGSDGVNGYSISRFQNQSTTGNMTGVFDMAGSTSYILASVISKLNIQSLYDINDRPVLYEPTITTKPERAQYQLDYTNKYLHLLADGDYTPLQYFCGNLRTTGNQIYQVTKKTAESKKTRFLTKDPITASTTEFKPTVDSYNRDEAAYLGDMENISFRIVIANSPAGSRDSMLFDGDNRIPSLDEPGFFQTDMYGNPIRNASGEFKDALGNSTFMSWEELINRGYFVEYTNGEGKKVLKASYAFHNKYDRYGLKYKTGILVIQDGIQIIGDGTEDTTGSFNGWTSSLKDSDNNPYGSLMKVVIPGSVELINDYAFYNDENLLKVQFSEGLQGIGHKSFANCKKLTNVGLPDSLVKIGGTDYDLSIVNYNTNPYQSMIGASFEGCTSITNIVLPKGLKIIGYRSFANCTALTNLSFGSRNLRIISAHAFYNTAIRSLHFVENDGLIIQKQAFRNCENLVEIIIPFAAVNRFEEGVFAYCTAIKEINFAVEDVAVFLHDSFNPSYTDGGVCGFFEGCTALETFDYSNYEFKDHDFGENTFYNCINLKTIRAVYPSSANDELQVIKTGTYRNCNNLTELTLPKSLTKIETYAFHVDNHAFPFHIYYDGTGIEWEAVELEAGWNGNHYMTVTCIDGVEYTYN